MRWPRGLAAGEVREQLAHGCDWLPTLAEFCGVSVEGMDLDGLSLANVLRSKEAATPHERLHWKTGGEDGQWVVREGRWKLIANAWDPSAPKSLDPERDRLFLADLVADPGERVNLAAEHPELVARLTAAHEAWAAKTAREGH